MTMLTASFDRAEEGAYDRMTQAWQWLCEQRTQAPDHADVWDIRWQNLNTGERWLTDLTERVLRGEYRLTPLQLQGTGEQRKAVWGAQDALVLKWAALSLQHQLPLHESCEHVKGYGSGKQSIEKLHSLLTAQSVDSEKKTAAGTTPDAAEIRHYKWVCRTDIRGYYRNINKQTLIQQVRQHVTAPVLRDLVQQYIHYTVEDGGTFHTPEKGISRGCPLSPLMGALHLFDMDEHFSNQPNIHYARYMDDIIILAKTRWSLRKHTKRLMQWFGEYGFEAHPDKTQIGRTAKGFDWMGARLTHEGVTDVAPRANANHREKVRRLYEQLARLPKWKRKGAAPKVNARVSAYRKRWDIWAVNVGPARRFTRPTVGVLLGTSLWFPLACCAQNAVVSVTSGGPPTIGKYQGSVRLDEVDNATFTDLAVWLSSAGGAIKGNVAASQYGNTIQTPASKTCGLGLTAVVSASSGYWRVYINGANYNAYDHRQYPSGYTSAYLVVVDPAATGTCAPGTVLGTVCSVAKNWDQSPTSMFKDQTGLASTCPSGSNTWQITLGAPYTPEETPACTLQVDPPSGEPTFPDVTPAAAAGTTKGSVLSVGTSVKITSSCTTSKGSVNVRTDGVYATKSGDFAKAGFDATTNTYVGLIEASNPKASLGSAVTDADFWTTTASSASPQITNLIPVVLRGGGAPTVGSGNVVMTVSAVAP